MLCGSGYEWRTCDNGIPVGAVSISSQHLEPAFIGREQGMKIRTACIDDKMMQYCAIPKKRTMLEILVASNVKKRKLDEAFTQKCFNVKSI